MERLGESTRAELLETLAAALHALGDGDPDPLARMLALNARVRRRVLGVDIPHRLAPVDALLRSSGLGRGPVVTFVTWSDDRTVKAVTRRRSGWRRRRSVIRFGFDRGVVVSVVVGGRR